MKINSGKFKMQGEGLVGADLALSSLLRAHLSSSELQLFLLSPCAEKYRDSKARLIFGVFTYSLFSIILSFHAYISYLSADVILKEPREAT